MRLEHLLSGALLKGISCSHSKTLATRLRRSGAKPQVARSNLRIVKFIDIIKEDEIKVTHRSIGVCDESKKV